MAQEAPSGIAVCSAALDGSLRKHQLSFNPCLFGLHADSVTDVKPPVLDPFKNKPESA
jgi:hypothetical protein